MIEIIGPISARGEASIPPDLLLGFSPLRRAKAQQRFIFGNYYDQLG